MKYKIQEQTIIGWEDLGTLDDGNYYNSREEAEQEIECIIRQFEKHEAEYGYEHDQFRVVQIK